MPKIKRIEICGFRSFREPQALVFESKLSIVWAVNSQGKTSVAEAMEFLFTGRTTRRELLGGAKSEFERCLRNVHLDESDPVWVSADIARDDGTVAKVVRVLVSDYTAERECVSTLTIDGTAAPDLTSLGFVLSDPPTSAPVLLQHNLRFALSSRPQDRTDYFKAILEIGDLDPLRDLLAERLQAFQRPIVDVVVALRAAAAAPSVGDELGKLEDGPLATSAIESALATAIEKVLDAHAGEDEGAGHERVDPGQRSLAELAEALAAALEQRRAKGFPLSEYAVGSDIPELPETWFEKWGAYRQAADESEVQLEAALGVFEEVLKMPVVGSATHPVDCPVCETTDALTPGRVATMRESLEAAKELRTAEREARAELSVLEQLLAVVQRAATAAPPACHALDGDEVIAREEAVLELLEEVTSHRQAMEDAKALATARTRLFDAAQELRRRITQLSTSPDDDLSDAVASLEQEAGETRRARSKCVESMTVLLSRLREALDGRQGLDAYRELVVVASSPQDLLEALKLARAFRTVKSRADGVLVEFDRAKLAVFEQRFDEMSDEIRRWWELLRPDESVKFDKVRARGTGRRFVDFKAVMLPRAGATGIERDALGVFSDSQLNALGVAAFLARSRLRSSPVVVLDDPLQAGDEQHRAAFVAHALEALLGEDVQVVVLSFDEMTQKLIQHRYAHVPVDCFAVTLGDPADGSIVVKGSNTAEALIHEASAYTASEQPAMRQAGASKLRTAAERTAKEILVKSRDALGETCSLDDYEGQTLGPLIDELVPYLTDPSHRGKWRNINDLTSPGAHDDDPPSRSDLSVAMGDVRRFHKEYLRT